MTYNRINKVILMKLIERDYYLNKLFPKMIIARTKHSDSFYEGIEIVDIARWLVDSQL